MNSLRPGVTNCSSHTEGCTPVSQWSKAMSFATCQCGVISVMRWASSSKQYKKNRCGYQCRQKCHQLVAKDGPFTREISVERAATLQSNKTTSTISARSASICPGCCKCWAKSMINAPDNPK